MIRDLLHYLVEHSLTVFWCISGKTYSSERVKPKKRRKEEKNNPAWRAFFSACISKWWQLIIATALFMGDLCSQCVVPCYWSKPGKLIKSPQPKSSCLQSISESGPWLTMQPSCSPKSAVGRTYCCKGKLLQQLISVWAIWAWESCKRIPNKKEEVINIPKALLQLTVRDKLMAGFLIKS